MTKTSPAPYTWDEIERQVRNAILCQFSILRSLGPDVEGLGELYLGIDPDLLEPQENTMTQAEYQDVLSSIPLARHHLHHLARNAYTYAYQLDGWEQVTADEHYEISCGVLNGFPQADIHGESSPLSPLNDPPLRRMFETFVARWKLYGEDFGSGLSVRELALLSNMTIPAVRTSLSKEGFKLEQAATRGDSQRRDDDRLATLNTRDALAWLSRRRGFVPNRGVAAPPSDTESAALFDTPDLTFVEALQNALSALGKDVPAIAGEIDAAVEWLEALLAGQVVDVDVPALRGLARTLKVPEPDFVAKAVRHLVGLDMQATADRVG